MKFLIVGLGNIGPEYELTRHNIGFLVADYLADQAKVSFEISKLASAATFKHRGKSIHIIKPSTFMNMSGKALNYWMQLLKIPVERTLVITDDIALPLGKIRLRPKGSDAGHNGLKNIETYVGQTYPRLKIGIGNDFPKGRQADYVLSQFGKQELVLLPEIIKNASNAALSYCFVGIQQTMNNFNH